MLAEEKLVATGMLAVAEERRVFMVVEKLATTKMGWFG